VNETVGAALNIVQASSTKDDRVTVILFTCALTSNKNNPF
jgi:hypothetical protein